MAVQDAETDFNFYLRFAKPLVLNLNEPNDRALAAAWIQKLRDETVASEELRTNYLKLLLFVLQRQNLIGPFSENPNEYQTLESLPTSNLHDVAKQLLESEEKHRKQKVEKGKAGPSGDFPPYSIEYSADLLEYSAAQDIPNFGVHAYYAISKEPLTNWLRTEKANFPRGMAMTIALEKTVISSPTKLGTRPKDKTPKSAKSEDKKKSPSPDRRKKIESLPSLQLSSGETQQEEEREPPNWGSNLIGVTDPPTPTSPLSKLLTGQDNLLMDDSPPSFLETSSLSFFGDSNSDINAFNKITENLENSFEASLPSAYRKTPSPKRLSTSYESLPSPYRKTPVARRLSYDDPSSSEYFDTTLPSPYKRTPESLDPFFLKSSSSFVDSESIPSSTHSSDSSPQVNVDDFLKQLDDELDDWDRKIAEMESDYQKEMELYGLPNEELSEIPQGSSASQDIITTANEQLELTEEAVAATSAVRQIPKPRSRLPQSQSKLPQKRSKLPQPPSRLPQPPSRLPQPPSRLPQPPSRLPQVPSRSAQRSSRLPEPPSRLLQPPSKLGQPQSKLGQPQSKLPKTGGRLPSSRRSIVPSRKPIHPNRSPGWDFEKQERRLRLISPTRHRQRRRRQPALPKSVKEAAEIQRIAREQENRLPRLRMPSPRTQAMKAEYEAYKKRYQHRPAGMPKTPPVFSRFRSLIETGTERPYQPSEFGLEEDIQWQPAEHFFVDRTTLPSRVDERERRYQLFSDAAERTGDELFFLQETMPELPTDDYFNKLPPEERSPTATKEENIAHIKSIAKDLKSLKVSIPAEAGIPLTTPKPAPRPVRALKVSNTNQQYPRIELDWESPPKKTKKPTTLSIEEETMQVNAALSDLIQNLDQDDLLGTEEIPLDILFSPPPLSPKSTKQAHFIDFGSGLLTEDIDLLDDEISPDFLNVTPDIVVTPPRKERRRSLSPLSSPESPASFVRRLHSAEEPPYYSRPYTYVNIGKTNAKRKKILRNSEFEPMPNIREISYDIDSEEGQFLSNVTDASTRILQEKQFQKVRRSPQMDIVYEHPIIVPDEELEPLTYPDDLMGEPTFTEWETSFTEIDNSFDKSNLPSPLQADVIYSRFGISPPKKIKRKALIIPGEAENITITPAMRDIIHNEYEPNLNYSPPPLSPNSLQHARSLHEAQIAERRQRLQAANILDDLEEPFADLDLELPETPPRAASPRSPGSPFSPDSPRTFFRKMYYDNSPPYLSRPSMPVNVGRTRTKTKVVRTELTAPKLHKLREDLEEMEPEELPFYSQVEAANTKWPLRKPIHSKIISKPPRVDSIAEHPYIVPNEPSAIGYPQDLYGEYGYINYEDASFTELDKSFDDSLLSPPMQSYPTPSQEFQTPPRRVRREHRQQSVILPEVGTTVTLSPSMRDVLDLQRLPSNVYSPPPLSPRSLQSERDLYEPQLSEQRERRRQREKEQEVTNLLAQIASQEQLQQQDLARQSRQHRSRLPQSRLPQSRLPQSRLTQSRLPQSRLPQSRLSQRPQAQSRLPQAQSRLPQAQSRLPQRQSSSAHSRSSIPQTVNQARRIGRIVSEQVNEAGPSSSRRSTSSRQATSPRSPGWDFEELERRFQAESPTRRSPRQQQQRLLPERVMEAAEIQRIARQQENILPVSQYRQMQLQAEAEIAERRQRFQAANILDDVEEPFADLDLELPQTPPRVSTPDSPGSPFTPDSPRTFFRKMYYDNSPPYLSRPSMPVNVGRTRTKTKVVRTELTAPKLHKLREDLEEMEPEELPFYSQVEAANTKWPLRKPIHSKIISKPPRVDSIAEHPYIVPNEPSAIGYPQDLYGEYGYINYEDASFTELDKSFDDNLLSPPMQSYLPPSQEFQTPPRRVRREHRQQSVILPEVGTTVTLSPSMRDVLDLQRLPSNVYSPPPLSPRSLQSERDLYEPQLSEQRERRRQREKEQEVTNLLAQIASQEQLQQQDLARQSRQHRSRLPQSRLPQSRLPQSRLPQSRLPQSRLPQSRLSQRPQAQSRLPQAQSRLPQAQSRLPQRQSSSAHSRSSIPQTVNQARRIGRIVSEQVNEAGPSSSRRSTSSRQATSPRSPGWDFEELERRFQAESPTRRSPRQQQQRLLPERVMEAAEIQRIARQQENILPVSQYRQMQLQAEAEIAERRQRLQAANILDDVEEPFADLDLELPQTPPRVSTPDSPGSPFTPDSPRTFFRKMYYDNSPPYLSRPSMPVNVGRTRTKTKIVRTELTTPTLHKLREDLEEMEPEELPFYSQVEAANTKWPLRKPIHSKIISKPPRVDSIAEHPYIVPNEPSAIGYPQDLYGEYGYINYEDASFTELDKSFDDNLLSPPMQSYLPPSQEFQTPPRRVRREHRQQSVILPEVGTTVTLSPSMRDVLDLQRLPSNVYSPPPLSPRSLQSERDLYEPQLSEQSERRGQREKEQEVTNLLAQIPSQEQLEQQDLARQARQHRSRLPQSRFSQRPQAQSRLPQRQLSSAHSRSSIPQTPNQAEIAERRQRLQAANVLDDAEEPFADFDLELPETPPRAASPRSPSSPFSPDSPQTLFRKMYHDDSPPYLSKPSMPVNVGRTRTKTKVVRTELTTPTLHKLREDLEEMEPDELPFYSQVEAANTKWPLRTSSHSKIISIPPRIDSIAEHPYIVQNEPTAIGYPQDLYGEYGYINYEDASFTELDKSFPTESLPAPIQPFQPSAFSSPETPTRKRTARQTPTVLPPKYTYIKPSQSDILHYEPAIDMNYSPPPLSPSSLASERELYMPQLEDGQFLPEFNALVDFEEEGDQNFWDITPPSDFSSFSSVSSTESPEGLKRRLYQHENVPYDQKSSIVTVGKTSARRKKIKRRSDSPELSQIEEIDISEESLPFNEQDLPSELFGEAGYDRHAWDLPKPDYYASPGREYIRTPKRKSKSPKAVETVTIETWQFPDDRIPFADYQGDPYDLDTSLIEEDIDKSFMEEQDARWKWMD